MTNLERSFIKIILVINNLLVESSGRHFTISPPDLSFLRYLLELKLLRTMDKGGEQGTLATARVPDDENGFGNIMTTNLGEAKMKNFVQASKVLLHGPNLVPV